MEPPEPKKKILKTVLVSRIPNKSQRGLERKHSSISVDKGKAPEKHVSREPKRNNRQSMEEDKGKKLNLDKQSMSSSSKSKGQNVAKESKRERKSSPEESKIDNSSSKHRKSSVKVDKGKKPELEKQLDKFAPGTSDSTEENVSEDPRRGHSPSNIDVNKAKNRN